MRLSKPQAGTAEAMAKLEEYERKRKPGQTPEPTGERPKGPRRAKEPRFVIQQHSARRLHWDLRLEHDGVLASWALPSGLPAEPGKNLKAVHTEDHPLEYLEFHGEIPAGNYGAGTMTIWDTGTYEPEKFEDEKVIVVLNGERARGRYALFRAGREEKDWMIHRMDPPERERDPMPEGLVPMMARTAPLPKKDDGWAYEVKWDGVRALAYSTPGRMRLESRNLKDVTSRYPELRPLNRALGASDAILDGEIVAFDEKGRPSFERLQPRMHLTRESDIKRRAKSTPVSYQLFDLLYLDGRNLMDEPYEERRRLLEELDLNGDAWQTPGSHRGDGRALLARTADLGLEGVVAKRLDSSYRPGGRSRDWLKVKNTRRQEFVIGGWLPQKDRDRELGALLVGYHPEPAEEDGRLRFAGKVGTGFTREEARRLVGLLDERARKESPFAGRRPQRGARFVEPDLVAEVDYGELTREGMLRHPSYKGLRTEKPASEVTLEVPEAEPAAGAGEPAGPDEVPVSEEGQTFDVRAVPAPKGRSGVEVEVEERNLRLTNLDKVLYPATGFTKRDLIDYYVRISGVLLPHLHDRPLTLKRYPNGVEGGHFFEKQCPSHRPEWIATAVVPSERKGTIEFCLVEELPTLVWLGNLADLELHPSLSVASDMEHPTAMAFDLDPGPGTDLIDCCRIGLLIHGMLANLGIQSFPKVSGKKGLHLFVPLGGTASYEEAKPFARQVAETLEQRFPEQVTSNMAKSQRKGRILVDWSQNDRHKTTLGPYSLRATEAPAASTPLTWEEVADAAESGDRSSLVFTPEQVLERVAEHGDLFAPVLSLIQELPAT
jgi:bifunctional non-homologous end joining protein LigD